MYLVAINVILIAFSPELYRTVFNSAEDSTRQRCQVQTLHLDSTQDRMERSRIGREAVAEPVTLADGIRGDHNAAG